MERFLISRFDTVDSSFKRTTVFKLTRKYIPRHAATSSFLSQDRFLFFFLPSMSSSADAHGITSHTRHFLVELLPPNVREIARRNRVNTAPSRVINERNSSS